MKGPFKEFVRRMSDGQEAIVFHSSYRILPVRKVSCNLMGEGEDSEAESAAEPKVVIAPDSIPESDVQDSSTADTPTYSPIQEWKISRSKVSFVVVVAL